MLWHTRFLLNYRRSCGITCWWQALFSGPIKEASPRYAVTSLCSQFSEWHRPRQRMRTCMLYLTCKRDSL